MNVQASNLGRDQKLMLFVNNPTLHMNEKSLIWASIFSKFHR